MRSLTLNEKIGLKGIFAKRGVILPTLDTEEAIYRFYFFTGKSIIHWYKYQ